MIANPWLDFAPDHPTAPTGDGGGQSRKFWLLIEQVWHVDANRPMSHPAVRVIGMTIIKLSLVDPALVGDDNDTWIESCLHCGTLENGGDNLCPSCDDLAA